MRKRGIVSGSPMTPVAREAFRDIVSSPSPSVKMLVSKHRQLENELEERARLEKEREAKRAEMIRWGIICVESWVIYALGAKSGDFNLVVIFARLLSSV